MESAILKGVNWLEKDFLDELNVKKVNRKNVTYKPSYLSDDILTIYILNKYNEKYLQEFISVSENNEFWRDSVIFYPDVHCHHCQFFIDIGLSNNKYYRELYEEMKSTQTIEGFVPNFDNHVHFLRIGASLEPESQFTQSALKYCMNYKFDKNEFVEYCIFLLALTELDYEKYKKIILKGINYIKKSQNIKGYWDMQHSLYNFNSIFYAIKLLLRVEGNNENPYIKKALDYVLSLQYKNGSFDSEKFDKKNKYKSGNTMQTEQALLILLLLKQPTNLSIEEYDFQKKLYIQKANIDKAYFIHTSPLYKNNLHLKEINGKIREGFESAEYSIRIISPYIDMHYEEIINKLLENPELKVRIITRPKKDIRGTRERIAKNVIDLLIESTKGNLRTLDIVHSRIVIIDDQELIVSSSDMTREGLIDEFNAGIYTKNPESIKDATEYFENIWDIASKENT